MRKQVEVIPELSCLVKGCQAVITNFETGAYKRIDRRSDLPLCPEHINTWWSPWTDDLDPVSVAEWNDKVWEKVDG